MIYCGELQNNGVLYHTFYDVETKKLRFFLDGQEVENEHLYSVHNKKKNALRGSSRLLTMLLSLSIITASLGVTALERGTDFSDFIPEFGREVVVEEPIHNELTGEELYEKLISLNEKEAPLIEMSKGVILDYGEYMNQQALLDTFADLEVVPTSDREEISSGLALAFYTKDENKIYIDDQLNVDSLIQTCLLHEVLHYYSQSGLYDFNTYSDGYMGYALNEGLTEMINSKYNDGELFTYHREAAYAGALYEIVGPDALLKSYFGNSVEMLVDELSQYGSREDAIALIKNIDISKDSYESFVYYGNDEDYMNFVNANINAWGLISEMYEAKFDKDCNDDRLMSAYKSATMLENFVGLDMDPMTDYLVDVIVNKGYFTDNDEEATVEYNIKNDYGITGNSLTIDESNRYRNTNSISR